MSNFKLTGTLKVSNATVQVSDKFSKREFVITEKEGMYPQDIQFQLTQDKCNLLDGIIAGTLLDVEFNFRGREWKSPQGEVKYFNTLEAWRITPLNGTPSIQNPTNVNQAVAESLIDEVNDDLPF